MVSQIPTGAEDPGTSRNSIFDSATEVFMEVGFSGARVDEIARRAHANKAMIYYHFGSKLGLYRAVLSRLFGDVLAEVEGLKTSEAPPGEKLRALYTRIAVHFGEKPALPHILLREILAGGKSMDAEAARTLGGILGFVRETLQEGFRTGVFRRVHPLLFHLSMLGPLMLHFASTSFQKRMLPRALPGLSAPGNEEMLAHLMAVLDRSLMPASVEPAVQRSQRKTK